MRGYFGFILGLILMGSMSNFATEYSEVDIHAFNKSPPSFIPCNDRDALTSGLRKPLGVVSLVRKLDPFNERRTFLYFHFIEEIVTFYSRGHWHDFVRHESASPSGASC